MSPATEDHKNWPAHLVAVAKNWFSRHFWITTVCILMSTFAGALWTASLAVGDRWTNTINRLDGEITALLVQRSEFSETYDLIHQKFGRDQNLPEIDEVHRMIESVRKTRTVLAALEAPTNKIVRTREEYQAALSELMGALNRYRKTPDTYLNIFNAFQDEANEAGALRDAVEIYTAGGIRSLWGTIF